MPQQMWDKPSAEITDLKTKCERLIEKYENEIEEWYWNDGGLNLSDYLCVNKALKGKETKCLNEQLPAESSIEQATETANVKTEL